MNVEEIINRHKNKYNEIYNVIHDLFKKNNYKSFADGLVIHLKKATLIFLLFLVTDLSFLDISNVVTTTLGGYSDNSFIFRDFVQYRYKLCCIIKFNISEEETNKKYTDPVNEVDERMMFRIELYKEGWSIKQIEQYIFKKFYSESQGVSRESKTPDRHEVSLKKFDEKIVEEYYSICYNNILINLKEKRNDDYKNKIGRPKLPPKIKEYLKKSTNEKIREIMRKKYSGLEEYKLLKENMLTYEELKRIKERMVDDEGILKKLEYFVKA
jgi:hypothetical protein